MMGNRYRYLRIAAWIVIVLSVCFVALLGAGVSSPSIVKDRQAIAEFGVAAVTVSVGLAVCARGLWKILAVPVFFCYVLCFRGGMRVESSRFARGDGGPWFGSESWQLLLFLGLFGAVCFALKRSASHSPPLEIREIRMLRNPAGAHGVRREGVENNEAGE